MTSAQILSVRYWFKVIGVHTVSLAAKVIKYAPAWNRASVPLVHNSMSRRTLVESHVRDAVSAGANAALPNPAWRSKAAILLNILLTGKALAMTALVSEVFAFDHEFFRVRLLGAIRGFTASAHTLPGRVGRSWGILGVHLGGLLHRLTEVSRPGRLHPSRGIRVPSLYQNPYCTYYRDTIAMTKGGAVLVTPPTVAPTKRSDRVQRYHTFPLARQKSISRHDCTSAVLP